MLHLQIPQNITTFIQLDYAEIYKIFIAQK